MAAVGKVTIVVRRGCLLRGVLRTRVARLVEEEGEDAGGEGGGVEQSQVSNLISW